MLEKSHSAVKYQRPPKGYYPKKFSPGGYYRAFGLNIRSEIPFMINNGVEVDPDVEVNVASLPEKWIEDPRAKDGYVEVEGDDIWFVWEELGVMKIHAGQLIIIDPIQDVRRSLLNQAVQSAGLGLILHQRHVLTLHASAVEVNGGIVAFVGYKGAGKSTTAASLFARGHRLVTDDLLVLEVDALKGKVNALPGIPQLRLWPDAVVASLDEDPRGLPRNSDLSTKRLRDAGNQFVQNPMPLRAIYVLDFLEDPTDALTIQTMAPRNACIELIRHSYTLHYLGNQGASAVHLSKSSLLTKLVPVRRLTRTRSLDAIPEMVDAIMKDTALKDAAPTNSKQSRKDTTRRVPPTHQRKNNDQRKNTQNAHTR